MYSKKQLSQMPNEELMKIIQNSELTNRVMLSQTLGKSFNGQRDMYEALGYKKYLRFQDYLGFYERDGLATVVVDKIADETWREPPFLELTNDKADDAQDTTNPLQVEFDALAEKVELYSSFSDLDAALGYSRYAVLLLGVPGNLSEDVVSNADNTLAYTQVYDEGQVEIRAGDLETDTASPDFGMPKRFWISMNDAAPKTKTEVHASRVLHVREGRGRSRLYGVPRLKKIINRLFDLEKVVGSSSEAFWLLVYKGFAVENKADFDFPEDDSPAGKALSDEIENYVHGLKRYMKLQGTEIKDLGSQVIHGMDQFKTIVSYIAGAMQIPQRVLIGSERGELASSQDDKNFADHINSRQTHFAEPRILRPFVKRMGEFGILQVPEKYFVTWPSLFSVTNKEKADIALAYAGAINTASNGAPDTIMPGQEFGKRYLDYTAPSLAPLIPAQPTPLVSGIAPESTPVVDNPDTSNNPIIPDPELLP